MIPVDVEQALLGACLLSTEAADLADSLVLAEDFGEPTHALIFSAISHGRKQGRRIDIKLVSAALGEHGDTILGDTGTTVNGYVARLAAGATTIVNVRDFARVVIEHAAFRRIQSVSDALAVRVSAGVGIESPAEVAGQAIAELDEIVTKSSISSVRRLSIGEAGAQAIEGLNERRMNGKRPGVTWGLVDMDKATLGMRRGQLIILAARPSAGKTTVAVSTALAAAREGAGVLFVSLEMVAQELAERALADLSYRNSASPAYSSIVEGNISDAEMERLIEVSEAMKKLPISIEQQGGLTVSQVISRARSLRGRWERANQSLDLIIIDHLGLLQASSRYAGQRNSEVGEITSSLKALAKEMDVPVLLLCQLNRSVESRENKRPALADLRDSGRIEEDADVVLFLYREAYYLERMKGDTDAEELARSEQLERVQNEIEISIAKQRQGPTRTVRAFVSMPHNAVRNLARPAFMPSNYEHD